MTMPSVLTKHQTKQYGPRDTQYYGHPATIRATVRYDDCCGNGKNSFAITGDIRNNDGRGEAGGCLHEEIARAFPELEPFIKWHLSSSDGPMYYIQNTLYWLGYSGRYCDGKPDSPPNLKHARSTAVWPDMPEDMLAPNYDVDDSVMREAQHKAIARLDERLPGLLKEFREAVEFLGFVW